MTDEQFVIRAYGKSELAMMYFSDSDAHVALNHLNSWIQRCTPLVEALKGCHQSRRAKFFSAQSVRHIVEFLGEP